MAELQRRMAELEQRLAASAGDDSAIAQGPGATAAASGAVAVARDVIGDIYMGAPPQNAAEALKSTGKYTPLPVATCPCAASTWGPAMRPGKASRWGWIMCTSI